MIDYKRILISLGRCITGYANKANKAADEAEKKKYEEYVDDFKHASQIVKEASESGTESENPGRSKADIDFSALSDEAQTVVMYMGATCRVPKRSYHFQDPEKRYKIIGYRVITLQNGSLAWQVSILPEDSAVINGSMELNLEDVEIVD